MVLRSQSGWRICAAGSGTRYEIAPIVFELFTGDQSCLRLFLCVWYRQHRNLYLEKVQKDTKEWGKSRFDEVFGVTNLCFGLFCSAGVLCSSELGFDFFCSCTKMLGKETWTKDYRFLFLYVLLFGFRTQQNVNSAPTFVFTSKIVSLAWSRATVGLTCSTNIRLSTLGVWTTYIQ